MTPYLVLADFKLDTGLVRDLVELDWRRLEVASVFERQDWILQARQRNIIWQTLCHYGIALQHVGTLLSCKLPLDLEQRILDQTRHLWPKILTDSAIIRLQMIYNGSIIPIHTDINRESSVVYPIFHHSPGATIFYHCDGTYPRGMLPPGQCYQRHAVDIKDRATLLDVTVPHSINYAAGTYTRQNPRVSLSFKFKTLGFDTLCSQIK